MRQNLKLCKFFSTKFIQQHCSKSYMSVKIFSKNIHEMGKFKIQSQFYSQQIVLVEPVDLDEKTVSDKMFDTTDIHEWTYSISCWSISNVQHLFQALSTVLVSHHTTSVTKLNRQEQTCTGKTIKTKNYVRNLFIIKKTSFHSDNSG